MEQLPELRTEDCLGLKEQGTATMPPSICTVSSLLSPLQSSCRVGSLSPIETDLAVLGGLKVMTQVQNIMSTTKNTTVPFTHVGALKVK